MIRKKLLSIATALLLASTLVGGCSVLSLQDTLPNAILNQQDPEIIRDGLPAFLIITDALVESDPDDSDYLLLATTLYSAYAGTFAGSDQSRRKTLSNRAYNYGYRALCEEVETVCEAVDQPFDTFQVALDDNADTDNINVLYSFASAWATWLQAHTDDWEAIAQLPKIKAIIQTVLNIDETHERGNAQLYMGVLESQIPPALGGKPEKARQHFERAVALSDDRNLFAKVLFAENYARLVYDRELHDQLLNEVVEADPVSEKLTLTNTLAQQKAVVLLSESEAYFE